MDRKMNNMRERRGGDEDRVSEDVGIEGKIRLRVTGKVRIGVRGGE